jgi:sugar phosphate isomerase/epimerase
VTWRIGLATGCCTDRSILDVLDAAAAAGVQGVEIGTPAGHFSPWDPSQVDAVAARLARLSLVPVSMHAPFGGEFDLAHHDPRHRSAAIDGILETARVLKRLGGRVLVVHPTDHVRAHRDVEAHLTWAADALRRVTDEAVPLGITIAIETPLPHLIGGHPDEFAIILRHVGDAARVCVDTGHSHLGGFTRRFIDLAGDRLVHVHAHDNRGRYDDHLAPGDGDIDWPAIVRALDAVQYAEWIILELTCPGHPMTDAFRRARQQSETLFTRVPLAR